MKILVIDDKDLHCDSACKAFDGHELTVVGSYDDAMELLCTGCGFDVVLSDLMLPMSRQTLASAAYHPGELVPYGFVLALRASLVGVPYVAVATDINHHKNAVSAALDKLEIRDANSYWYDGLRPNFTINGTKAFFVHAPFTKAGAKDWGKILEALLKAA